MGQGPSTPRRAPYDEPGAYSPEVGAMPWSAPQPATSEEPRTPTGAASPSSTTQTANAPRAPLATAPAAEGAAPAAPSAAPAAAPAAAAANPAPAAQRPSVPGPTTHKATTLIPAWSRPLSSQALQIEAQKIWQPQRTPVSRDVYGVLELEVMKYVAYCGGLSLQFRIDELQYGPVDAISWGLASTRAAPGMASPSVAGAAALGSNSPGQDAGSSASASSIGSSLLRCSVPHGSGSPDVHRSRPSSKASVAPSLSPDASPAGSPRVGQAPGADPSSPASPRAGASSIDGAGGAAAAAAAATSPASAVAPGQYTQVIVDNMSRKPLYMISTASSPTPVSAGDVISFEMIPKEERVPMIGITLKYNGAVVSTSSLPAATFSHLQMFPFMTLPAGMHVSLHEATTPSPLFTWFAAGPPAAPVAPAPEGVLCELDSCIKFATTPPATPPATPTPPAAPHSTAPVEFYGATSFTKCRARWTIQLDNYSATPTYVFVGVVSTANENVLPAPPSSVLSTVQGPLKSIAGSGNAASAALAAAAAAGAAAGPSSPLPPAPSAAPGGGASTSGGAAAAAPATPTSPDVPLASAAETKPQPKRWGAWVKLPGSLLQTQQLPAGTQVVQPPAPVVETFIHTIDSTTSHCFITVDLDLNNHYVRFFRNGHLIGHAFTGVSGHLCPALYFQPPAHPSAVAPLAINCQAGLVNLTKLRQLDLKWNAEKCSGDLRITNAASVAKVSEVYGDYSTVLANEGFISGVHLWLVKINNLSEPDSIFIGVCRGCMPLDQDPQDLRDRTYYLSNGVIRVGGRRVATNAANFTKGDVVGVVLDADQGEIVFFRNGSEQGRAKGIRGRLYPFVSCDSEGDQISLLGSYTLLLNRVPRGLADMEWDTLGHGPDMELSSNCLTATKTTSLAPSTVRGTILYTGATYHEFHVILDTLGPDGVWVGVAPPGMDPSRCVGDAGCGWAVHSDGDRRCEGREEEYTGAFKNGDVLTVGIDLGRSVLRFSRNGVPLGDAFTGIQGPLIAAVTLASEESKVTIQNRPTVLNTGEYSGELRWDEARAGRDLHVIDGLTVTKMANEGGDYATVLGTLCLASGQHSWNIYINHVEDSNLFIGVTVGGHDLNADPQEMKHRTYYLSNGTIRVAGKLVTRCAEPYAEGDLVTVQLDMDARTISFLKNGAVQGTGDGLPDEVWPYVSLDNIMDSITLHSSSMFVDLAHTMRWDPKRASKWVVVAPDTGAASLKTSADGPDAFLGQATVLGVREYARPEVHSWVVRLEQPTGSQPCNFLVGVAPPNMDLNRGLGEEHCGIGLDYYGYFYVSGRYFHVSNLCNWSAVAKPVRGSTAKHKGKATPVFTFVDGKCEVTLTLDLKEGTLKFATAGRTIGTIAGVKATVHAAITLTSPLQTAGMAAGPIGKSEHTNEELVNILKAKGLMISSRMEAALLLIPRDLFVPRDRHREAFRDQKVTVRMADGSTMTLPPPSFVAQALEALELRPGCAFLDIGVGSGYVTSLAAMLVQDQGTVSGIECLSGRLEAARTNVKTLKERLSTTHPGVLPPAVGPLLPAAVTALGAIDLSLSNVLIPECTEGRSFDALYCDASLSEEDLPAFLALLKPGGRMVAILEEDALLITRGGDMHDFTRATLAQVSGDFGDLEQPTPWEVQEAIQRIKERERRKGSESARVEAAGLRNHEYDEMAARVAAAMARINELEGTVSVLRAASEASTPGGSLAASAPRSPFAQPGAAWGALGAARSPSTPTRLGLSNLGSLPLPLQLPQSPHHQHLLNAQQQLAMSPPSPVDDVHITIRDKGTRRSSSKHQSPRTTGNKSSPPGADASLGGAPPPVADGEWRSPYSSPMSPEREAAFKAVPRSAARELLLDEADDMDQQQDDDSAMAAAAAAAAVAAASSYAYAEMVVDSLALVQALSVDAVQGMIASQPPVQQGAMGGLAAIYSGVYKGLKVRVCQVAVRADVSPLELRRVVNRYCIAHPNISSVLGMCVQPAADAPDSAAAADADAPPAKLWIVEEAFGEETLHGRLERGLLSWQQVASTAIEITKAAAYLQDLRMPGTVATGPAAVAMDVDDPPASPGGGGGRGGGDALLLTPLALSAVVHPQNVHVSQSGVKLSVLPALLHQLEPALVPQHQLADAAAGGGGTLALRPSLSHLDMAYRDPTTLFADPASLTAHSFYSLGVVLAQLLTEQAALGLMSALREALGDAGASSSSSAVGRSANAAASNLRNLVARLATSPDLLTWCDRFARLALRCTQPGAVTRLEAHVLPALLDLQASLSAAKSTTVSWEQVEEMLMLPLQPVRSATGPQAGPGLGAAPLPGPSAGPSGGVIVSADAVSRRWIRQDFRIRRKLFLEEVAKLAVDGPVHKIEVRRARCFKDSLATFAGKGHAVWRQPLKVTFIGEAGMDSGGVTREWFATLSSAISYGSPDLFYTAGPQNNQLYVNPLANTPSHLKKYAFVGLFMAKSLLESAARGKELGIIPLNLTFCEPFWKLLLGLPLHLMDLQLLDPQEFRSLMQLLEIDVDGLIFENFTWTFQPPALPSAPVQLPSLGPPGTPEKAPATASAASVGAAGLSQQGVGSPTPVTPSGAAPPAFSPFAYDGDDGGSSCITLKPGGSHIKVSNHNKREYVLLKAHKMLVGAVEAQSTAIIDAFHSLIPRELVDKYKFTSLEMQLLVCGEQRIDVADLRRYCRYEDGYTGKEDVITWFWAVVEAFDDTQRRQLLQFWSGSDGMPPEGFGSLDPAFHIVAVERMYDANDTTARLPAAHTCFRQLDLPRYASAEELKEKVLTAVTMGQGYMALS